MASINKYQVLKPYYKISALALAFALFVTLWVTMIPAKRLPQYSAQTHSAVEAEPGAPWFADHWVSRGETAEAHSANIVVMGNTPLAVWYGGTEEGHKDVAVFMSSFVNHEWSAPKVIMNRTLAEAGLNRYIRKLGNPVIHPWPDGSLGLFFVSVSFGGWAASSINYMESPDLGHTWSRPERLVTSPFLNLSTLVRTDGLNLVGGDLSLPVYHEMAGKFAETLHLSRSRVVLDKVRISRGKHSLQPAIASLDANQGIALLRYAGGEPRRLLSAQTLDGGLHWEPPGVTNLANPNAAVALVNLGDGTLLMALNDLEQGRHRLSLAINEGDGWKIIRTLEEEREPQHRPGREPQFSYPSFAIDEDGLIHLVYTWNVRRIRHLSFNRAWLMLPGS